MKGRGSDHCEKYGASRGQAKTRSRTPGHLISDMEKRVKTPGVFRREKPSSGALSKLVFVTGRGGAGFHLAGPALSAARGRYSFGYPRPTPVQGTPLLIPWTGPVCHHQILTGTRLGGRWGGCPGGDSGRECQKLRPAPGHWAGRGGGKGQGPAVFGAPEAL